MDFPTVTDRELVAGLVIDPFFESAYVDRRFGLNLTIGNGVETIVVFGGLFEFLDAATTVRVKAGGDAADDIAGTGAQQVKVEGLSGTYERIEETLELAGAAASASTSQSFLRVLRATVTEVGSGDENVGDIVLENTAGTLDLLTIRAADGRSLVAVETIPAGYQAKVTRIEFWVDSGKQVIFRLWERDNDNGAVKRTLGILPGIGQPIEVNPKELILDEKTDFWITAEGDGATARVAAVFELTAFKKRGRT